MPLTLPLSLQDSIYSTTGVVEKVWYDKEPDTYYADSRITDPKAKEYINGFHGKQVPIQVSPQLVYDANTELPNYYKNWEFTHLAIMDASGVWLSKELPFWVQT